MDNIFMNFENSKTLILILNIPDKIKLKEVINMLLYQILAFTLHGKI